MKNVIAAFLVATAGLSAAASADVLWDQSQLSGTGASVPNSISGSPPFGATMYAVSDVVVPAGGWTINSVSTYFSALGFTNWATNVTQARLSIFSRTGALPGAGDIPNSALISVTCTSSSFDAGPGFGIQGVNVCTASGLNITLPAGNYWIGLSPVAPGGFDLERAWPSSNIQGGNSATWSAFADIGVPAHTWQNAGAESAILITGVPTPSAAALLGLAGLATGRRRTR